MDKPNIHWFTSERDKKHSIALKKLRSNYHWEEPMKFFQRNQLSLTEKTRASERERRLIELTKTKILTNGSKHKKDASQNTKRNENKDT